MLRVFVPLCLVLLSAGCLQNTADPTSQGTSVDKATSIGQPLVFLTRDGCVNTTTMRANLDQALGSMGLPAKYEVIDLAALAEHDVRGGYPTPTVLYQNTDLFGMAEPRAPFPPPT